MRTQEGEEREREREREIMMMMWYCVASLCAQKVINRNCKHACTVLAYGCRGTSSDWR